jgi:hypothetical protein
MLTIMLVTCLPGADRRNVRAALREVQTSLADVRGGAAGLPLSQRLLNYLNWVNAAERLLRSQISRGDIEQLILTRRYETLLSSFSGLASSTGSTDGVLAGLLSSELDTRLDALDEALTVFTRQLDQWTGSEDFVLPDTTLYIHHPQKLEDLDFAAELDTQPPVRVLVPMVVVDELDGLKQSKDRHVRWRARHTLQIIDDVFSHGVEPAALRKDDPSAPILELFFDQPGHVRLPIVDDEIIDRAAALQPLAVRPITLITFDTGQSTRARAAGLRVRKLREPIGDEPTTT